MTGPLTPLPRRVLFLCTGNSCRSQMAEGLLRELSPGGIESLSAGAQPSGYVHAMAIEVMGELEIDISDQHSKSIDEFLEPPQNAPHLVISVCDSAADRCPQFPGGGVERLHWPFDDPAEATGTDDQKRAEFRRVRDEIRLAIEQYLGPAV